MSDLWSVSRTEIDRAVRAIVTERGYSVARVYSLSSGLYVNAELTNGSMVTIGDRPITSWLWNNGE